MILIAFTIKYKILWCNNISIERCDFTGFWGQISLWPWFGFISNILLFYCWAIRGWNWVKAISYQPTGMTKTSQPLPNFIRPAGSIKIQAIISVPGCIPMKLIWLANNATISTLISSLCWLSTQWLKLLYILYLLYLTFI